MRWGTTTMLVALGIALAGCGQSPGVHAAAANDSIVVAHDASSSFNNFGPEWQADTNLARQMPKADDTQVYPADDDAVRQPPALPSCPGGPTVHFDTPDAAMTYLASAWNRDDLADLCQVTNPNSRFLLNDMHREAVNLRLKNCDRMDVGLYQCTFVHDYPQRMHRHGHGQTWLEVAAADNPGWYLLDYVGCG